MLHHARLREKLLCLFNDLVQCPEGESSVSSESQAVCLSVCLPNSPRGSVLPRDLHLVSVVTVRHCRSSAKHSGYAKEVVQHENSSWMLGDVLQVSLSPAPSMCERPAMSQP